MRSNMIELNLREAVEELSAMKPALSSSIGRFARDLEAENRPDQGQPRTGQRSTRLPGPRVGRVVAHRGASPRRLRMRIPATVVQRQRMLEARRRGGPLSPERMISQQAIREAVERIADAIRNRLHALHDGLANVRRGLQVRTRVVQADFGSAPRRAPPIGSSGGRLLSLLAIVAAVAIGVSAIAHGAKSVPLPFASRGPNDRVGILAQAIATAEGYYAPGERYGHSLSHWLNNPVGPNDRVGILAQAIAAAEGYYAPGKRDGHSLPHRLNNPGSLRKPALGAETLPTWKDMGLIVFPTERMGWDALKHQVELMLTGNSSIYDPSDSILDVAKKYAHGDLNWGKNVARKLGISPSCTLGEIAGARPNSSSSGDVCEPNQLQLAENAQTAIQK